MLLSRKFCGLFKTPTPRNVTRRSAFFHNGVIHSLEQALRFYVTRDTKPEPWYPTVGGVQKAVPVPTFPTYGLVTAQYVGGRAAKYDHLPILRVRLIVPKPLAEPSFEAKFDDVRVIQR